MGMVQEVGRLTKRKVAALGPGMHSDGAGLYLRVSASGSKSWIYRYSHNKQTHDMGLGSLHTIDLAEARERARKQRQLILDGIDPITTRRSQAPIYKVMSFRDAAEAMMATMLPSLSDKSQDLWRTSMRDFAYPIIGNLPIASVDRAAVLRVLMPIWSEKTETASRVRGRIEAVIGWAVQHGHRPEGHNPATWKGALEHAGLPKPPKAEHHAAMPWQHVPTFVRALQDRKRMGYPAKALLFTILTAARAGEVRGAKWSEITSERLWIIPAERMKARIEHRVPLSKAASHVLNSTINPESDAGLLFPMTTKIFPGVSQNAMKHILQTTEGGKGFTVHGFRSSFRDWCAETGVDSELAEAALAHTKGSATEAAYYRTTLVERRRPVMEAWGEHVIRVLT